VVCFSRSRYEETITVGHPRWKCTYCIHWRWETAADGHTAVVALVDSKTKEKAPYSSLMQHTEESDLYQSPPTQSLRRGVKVSIWLELGFMIVQLLRQYSVRGGDCIAWGAQNYRWLASSKAICSYSIAIVGETS